MITDQCTVTRIMVCWNILKLSISVNCDHTTTRRSQDRTERAQLLKLRLFVKSGIDKCSKYLCTCKKMFAHSLYIVTVYDVEFIRFEPTRISIGV